MDERQLLVSLAQDQRRLLQALERLMEFLKPVRTVAQVTLVLWIISLVVGVIWLLLVVAGAVSLM